MKKIPAYIRFGTEIFLWLTEQKPRKQNELLTKMREIFDGILKNVPPVINDSNHDGRMLASFEAFVSAGFSAYKAHNDSLPNGKPNGKPNEPLNNKTETESDLEQDHTNRQQTDALTQEDIKYLKKAGCTDEEIEWAMKLDYSTANTPKKYAFGSIVKRRKQNTPKADFVQRPPEEYDNQETPEEMLERLQREGV